MQPDQNKVAPLYFPCDAVSRDFPPEWKDIWFRRFSKVGDDGLPRYECPLCKKLFDHSNVGYLQGDHIWPYSMCGETSWGNYRLICGSCNAAKRDYIDGEVRRALGNGEFRRVITSYLRELVSRGTLRNHVILEELLGPVE